MTKKHLYYSEAERMFVIDQMTFDDIVTRLPLSEKTLQRWKSKGKWQEKREQYIKSRQAFHDELYEFARYLMKSIKADLQNGEPVDQSRFYTFTRILSQITKVKEYEDIVTRKDDKQNKGITPDVVKLIEQEVLGISYE